MANELFPELDDPELTVTLGPGHPVWAMGAPDPSPSGAIELENPPPPTPVSLGSSETVFMPEPVEQEPVLPIISEES